MKSDVKEITKAWAERQSEHGAGGPGPDLGTLCPELVMGSRAQWTHEGLGAFLPAPSGSPRSWEYITPRVGRHEMNAGSLY